MLEYIKLCRVNQWVKNLLIFAPLFFSFKFTHYDSMINALYAFIGFSFIASAIYIINDWKDIESDRLHPTKRYRPLASGKISPKNGLILFSLLVLLGLSVYLFIIKDTHSTILVTVYFLLNIAYTFKLKQIPILDITIVASGFVIRLFVGSFVTNTNLSYWLIILTFLLALLLVIGKRRHDVMIFEETKQAMRKSIAGYNLEFLNSIIIVIVTSIFICYLMYTISPEVVERNGEYLYLTSLFVFLGLFRYLQAVFVEKKGDSPTKLVSKDRFLQIDIAFWIISFISISYIYQNF